MRLKTNKTILRRLAAAALAAAMWLTPAFSAFAEGETDTIHIRDSAELARFSKNCALDTWSQGKTVVLEADIVLTDSEFEPIPTFGGIFDGQGHTISGLSVGQDLSPAGLFSVVQDGAVIKNLKVSGSVIPQGSAESVGGIAGENNGTISGCSFTGTVTGKSSTGGIAGMNGATGRITACDTSGAVFGEKMTGGVAGSNLGSMVGCVNAAYVNIESSDPTVDLDQLQQSLTLDVSKMSSINTVNVSSDTGGVAGYSSGLLEGCVNRATVGYQHVGYNVGGVVGRSCGYILGCTNSAAVYGRKDTGGVAGQLEPYIDTSMSADTVTKLQNQLDELSAMVDGTLTDAENSLGSITSRLNKIADYVDSAANAARDISVIGNLNGYADASGSASGEASGEVTPPELEAGSNKDVWGSIGADFDFPDINADGGLSSAKDIYAGLTEGGFDLSGGTDASGSLNAGAQMTMNVSLDGLAASISGMAGQARLLNGDINGLTGSVTEDLKAINRQINAITTTLFDALDAQSGNILEDTSVTDPDDVTLGKARSCRNRGEVYGDINVGGIAGSMAIEYELDPEDDVTGAISGSSRRKYELKVIVQNCENTGAVTAKRSYAGGVCGRMDLGMITDSRGFGNVTSESGSYVGGIAGLSSATVRSCYAKCTLSGDSYIGGILGSGTAESLTGSESLVAGCRSMVDITEARQYSGAVAGAPGGEYQENTFVSDTLAGIDTISQTGKAEPVSYETLCAETTLPEEMRSFTLRFVAGGEELKSVSFSYGDSFGEEDYPDIPEVDGSYGEWDCTDLSRLHFDKTVTAVYHGYVQAISADAQREDGRPVFFVQGDYNDGSVLEVTPLANTPGEFKTLSDGLGKTVNNYISTLRLGQMPAMYINRSIIEQWHVILPDDGAEAHTLRYLAPDGGTDGLEVYVRGESGWEKTGHDTFGSYLTFDVKGSETDIAILSTFPVWWVWLIAGLIVLAVVIIIIILVRRARRRIKGTVKKIREKTKQRETAAETAPAEEQTEKQPVYAGAPPDGEDSELLRRALSAEERLAEAENEIRRLRGENVPESAPKQAALTAAIVPEVNAGAGGASEGAEKPKKKKRHGWIIGVIVVILVAAATAAAWLYLESGGKEGIESYRLVHDTVQRPETGLDISITAQLGDSSTATLATLRKAECGGKSISCVETNGIPLYYSDGRLILENGKMYSAEGLLPDYMQLLSIAERVCRSTELTTVQKDGKTVYSVSVGGDSAAELLKVLIPDAAEYLGGADSVSLTLTDGGSGLSTALFESSGALTGGNGSYSVTAEMTIVSSAAAPEVPEAVQAAALSSEQPGRDITPELLRLIRAWSDINGADSVSAQIDLAADCGPLIVDDSLKYFRVDCDGTDISCIKKKNLTIYFSGDRRCRSDGRQLSASEEKVTSSAALIDIAYQLCLSGEFDCAETKNGGWLYTLTLDEAAMAEVARAIAPDIKDSAVALKSGSLVIELENDAITRVRVDCAGGIEIVLSEAQAALSAEISFTDGKTDIPAAVVSALAQ